MARRFAPLALLAVLALGGCAYGTAARLTPAQEQARVAFIKAHKDFSDRDMAKLCPGLYPADFLTNHVEVARGEGEIRRQAVQSDGAGPRRGAGRRLRRAPRLMDETTLERFAELLVGFAANVQPGQIVAVSSEIGKEPLTRAITASAYRHGATYVDVAYADPFVRRARIEHGSDAALETVPSWIGERILALGDQRCARIALTGPTAPDAAGGPRPRARRRRQSADAARGRQGAQRPHDELDDRPLPDARLGRAGASRPRAGRGARSGCGSRSSTSAGSTRPTRSPPGASGWRRSSASTERLTAARFDALHFEGPGTDLTVGLLPSSSWLERARSRRSTASRTSPTCPTEEVFTTPDPDARRRRRALDEAARSSPARRSAG